ncbi:hypothetical protein ACJIZ3_023416 [Penstemon smallii]|uniref:F-box domain-containing protein n=1 Tax=Penstemon smallii TaxID=265156 RepID=A0ABD3TRE3_9LAMI
MEITNIAGVYRTGQAKGREIPISSITLNSDYKVKKYNGDIMILQALIHVHFSQVLFASMNTFPARFRRVEKLIAISNSSSPARFLQLPDEVLRRILWFLPVEDAVRTSILSKRWKTYMDVNHRS